VSQLTLI